MGDSISCKVDNDLLNLKYSSLDKNYANIIDEDVYKRMAEKCREKA